MFFTEKKIFSIYFRFHFAVAFVVFVDFIQIDFSQIRFAESISFFWELFAKKPSNQFQQKEQR